MRIAILPGDGIGPEIMAQAVKVLRSLALPAEMQEAPVGGAGYAAAGDPLPAKTLALARDADAVLFGAVGDPRYDTLERAKRPEQAILRLRKELGLFANLRPARVQPELAAASALKPEVVAGLDILIVRELTGDIYFGEPKGIRQSAGEREGFDTMRYRESEIRRIARVAFDAARGRGKRVCSVDKANVLETSQLWREVLSAEAARYPDIALTHMYVDNCAMQLVRNPKQFDVIVTGNLFGDILSDEASMLTGSIWSKSRSSRMRCTSTDPTMPRQPTMPTLNIAIVYRASKTAAPISCVPTLRVPAVWMSAVRNPALSTLLTAVSMRVAASGRPSE